MAVICEKCGEPRGLFHKCAKKDVNAEQMEAASAVMQPEAKEFMPAEAVIKAQERKPVQMRDVAAKKDAPRKAELEAVKQMVEAPDNHEAVQDDEIREIVGTLEVFAKKINEHEEAFEVLEKENIELMARINDLESFAAGIRFERGAQPAKMDDLG